MNSGLPDSFHYARLKGISADHFCKNDSYTLRKPVGPKPWYEKPECLNESPIFLGGKKNHIRREGRDMKNSSKHLYGATLYEALF